MSNNSIWKQPFDTDLLAKISVDTMVPVLGILFTRRGDDFLEAEMPVNANTVQPMRLLHGGASAALAETIGSVASLFCLEDISREVAVGIELNISHLRSAQEGSRVRATCRPYRLGRSLHVWNIEIRHCETGELLAVSRLTMAVKGIGTNTNP